MRRLCLLTLIALAACGPAETPTDTATSNETAAIAPAQPAAVGPATSAAEGEVIAEGQEQAAAADLEWTGRFAATRELCTGGVWDIKEDRIVTDGHTACDIDRVARGAGQVTLRLACIAEGTPSSESWTLTRNDADGLSVALDNGRETINVDLLRCG